MGDLKAHLGDKIEAVDAKVDLVYHAVIELHSHDHTNRRDHRRFTSRLDDHDVRILALEHTKKPKS